MDLYNSNRLWERMRAMESMSNIPLLDYRDILASSEWIYHTKLPSEAKKYLYTPNKTENNMQDQELKITASKVREAASKCTTANATLRTLFPEAFREKTTVARLKKVGGGWITSDINSFDFQVGDLVTVNDISYLSEFKINNIGQLPFESKAVVLSITEPYYLETKTVNHSLIPFNFKIRLYNGEIIYCSSFNIIRTPKYIMH
jgi:hypothetical protein